MSCISGQADSCKTKAIEPTFDYQSTSLSNFEGETQQVIVDIAAEIFGE